MVPRDPVSAARRPGARGNNPVGVDGPHGKTQVNTRTNTQINTQINTRINTRIKTRIKTRNKT